MNRYFLILIGVLALVLSACGGGSSNPDPDPDPDPDNALAGTHLGDVTIENIGYFSNASFAIDNAGVITGTVISKSPSNVPEGEEGTVTGTVKIDSVTGDAGFISVDVTVESPTLGKYALTGGTGQYGTVAGKTQLAVSGFTIKDASGTFVGTGGIVTGNKQ